MKGGENMRYYSSGMLTQVFIIALILGWTLRELGQAGKEIWKITLECIEMPKNQKIKKLAQSLATQRVSKSLIIRG